VEATCAVFPSFASLHNYHSSIHHAPALLAAMLEVQRVVAAEGHHEEASSPKEPRKGAWDEYDNENELPSGGTTHERRESTNSSGGFGSLGDDSGGESSGEESDGDDENPRTSFTASGSSSERTLSGGSSGGTIGGSQSAAAHLAHLSHFDVRSPEEEDAEAFSDMATPRASSGRKSIGGFTAAPLRRSATGGGNPFLGTSSSDFKMERQSSDDIVRLRAAERGGAVTPTGAGATGGGLLPSGGTGTLRRSDSTGGMRPTPPTNAPPPSIVIPGTPHGNSVPTTPSTPIPSTNTSGLVSPVPSYPHHPPVATPPQVTRSSSLIMMTPGTPAVAMVSASMIAQTPTRATSRSITAPTPPTMPPPGVTATPISLAITPAVSPGPTAVAGTGHDPFASFPSFDASPSSAGLNAAAAITSSTTTVSSVPSSTSTPIATLPLSAPVVHVAPVPVRPAGPAPAKAPGGVGEAFDLFFTTPTPVVHPVAVGARPTAKVPAPPSTRPPPSGTAVPSKQPPPTYGARPPATTSNAKKGDAFSELFRL
jgi:hypothetical protein